MHLIHRFLWICSFVVLLSVSAHAQTLHPLVAAQGYADLILVNGNVVSMDDRTIVPNTPGNIYEAMAVKGKTIMALGTNAEIRALAGPATQTIEVGNKTVLPGLIQPHYHLFGTAARRYGPSLHGHLPKLRTARVFALHRIAWQIPVFFLYWPRSHPSMLAP